MYGLGEAFPVLVDTTKLATDAIRAAQRKPLEDAARQYEAEQREHVYAVMRQMQTGEVEPLASPAYALPDIVVDTFPWWLAAIGAGLVLAVMNSPKGGDW